MIELVGPFAPPAAIAAFIAAGVYSRGRAGNLAGRAAEAAAWTALALALSAAGALALGAGAGGLFRVDALSALMFALVSFIGLVVTRYSGPYLDGDPRQGVFFSRLCLTLGSVLGLATAGDVIVLLAAWIATSLSLHGLLLFRSERPGAAVAARKKFIIARIGDVCLGAALFLVAARFGSTNIGAILAGAEAARAAGEVGGLGPAAILIAVAAALKSAQFPTHGWLIEVMETPTPVSALLHAGVINAGGFVVIRFADVMTLDPSALMFLALIGGFTALFGSIVMLSQTSVKVALAYSTVAQMGFMLLQCGLGAFSAATLHIIAHSLYKAHAFLSSGRAVQLVKARKAPSRPSLAQAGVSLAAAGAVYLAIGAVFGLTFPGVAAAKAPAIITLGAIFVMGATILIAEGGSDASILRRVVGVAAASSFAYFALQTLFAALMAGVAPEPRLAPGIAEVAVMALAGLSFAGVAFAQLFRPAESSGLFRAGYALAANGLYANALMDRLVGAGRLRRATASNATV